MKRFFGKAALAACIWLTGLLSPAFSQQLTLNPMSYYGVGDIVFPSSPRNAAMGGTGIATTSYFTVNQINPATWADVTLSSLDVSGFGQVSQLRNAAGERETQGTGSFQNAGMAFPANNGLVFALGFAPYSVMGYNVLENKDIAGDTTVIQQSEYTGSGGLNRVYGGVSGKFWNKRILWGASYTFNFGEIRQSTQTRLFSESTGALLSGAAEGLINHSTYLHGSGFQGGIVFCDTLMKKAFKARPMKDQKFPLKLRVGATADYTLPTSANLILVSQTRVKNANTYTTISSNTYEDTDGQVNLPLRAGLGVELSKPGKFYVAADGFWQNWAQYRYYGTPEARYGAYRGVNAGVEWIPDILSTSYFKRMSFRGGAYFHQTPLTYSDASVNDMGITLGLGIPPARGTSSINLSVALGKRGSVAQSQPIEEYYTRIQLGVTLNERWFVRRVVD